MSIPVNNGRRATIAFGGSERECHVVDRRGVILAAFFGEKRQLAGVDQVMLDGVAHAVIEPPEKGDVRGTVLVALRPVGETDG